MITEPLDKLDAYAAAGADILTVHLESTVHIHRVLQRLGALENANRPGEGIVRGLALDPGTPLAGKEILVCVDGGVTTDNIAGIAAGGADLVVTGSAVFDGKAAEANAGFVLAAVRGGATQ